VEDLTAQRFVGVDEQVVHLGDGVELGGPLHQLVLTVSAAPRQHIEPDAVVEPHELGPEQRRAQPLGLGNRRRSNVEQPRDRLLGDADAKDLQMIGHGVGFPPFRRRVSPLDHERPRCRRV
jgi:hypothetical protein